MQRRKFSKDLKLEAVKLVTERGMKATQVGRDMDIDILCITQVSGGLGRSYDRSGFGLFSIDTPLADRWTGIAANTDRGGARRRMSPAFPCAE